MIDHICPHYVLDCNITERDIVNDMSLYGLSNYNSGDTVAEVIENIRYLSYEVVVIFDKQHRKILDFTSYKANNCHVHFPSEWIEHLGILIHNHPNSNWDFSAQDLKLAADIGCPTLIVVCRNFTFVIEHWPHEWRKEAPHDIRHPDDWEDFINQHYFTDDLIEHLMDHFAEAGLTTRYTIYDAKGKILYALPRFCHVEEMTMSELRRVVRANRHLNYIRKNEPIIP